MSRRARGIETGTAIEVVFGDETWIEAIVLEPLSAQFTADVEGYVRFFFYSDEGVTWRAV